MIKTKTAGQTMPRWSNFLLGGLLTSNALLGAAAFLADEPMIMDVEPIVAWFTVTIFAVAGVGLLRRAHVAIEKEANP